MKPTNVFNPFPWQIPAWRDKSPILLLSGAAGGGKSRLAGEKIHALCLKYPGSTGLILRKTRESLKNSTILFMDRKVIGSSNPHVQFIPSSFRFEYDNSSILSWGGMKDDDQRESIRSIGQDGALDWVWMEEAHLFTRFDFDEVLSRMRGKAAPWTQIILSTNPDAPGHWIKKELIDGKLASYHKSTWRDNPANPADYEQTLNMLSEPLRSKLRDGLWVMAEGAIYPEWTEENISHLADFHPDYPIFASVDDGYTNPRCVLLIQERPVEGKPDRICVFAEYYKTQQLAENTLKEIWPYWSYPLPEFIYYDPSAIQFAATAQELGHAVWGAYNGVPEGIKVVRNFIKDHNGERRLLVHPRCVNLIEQFPTYRYSDTGAMLGSDPKPLKENDHAVDSLRYYLATTHLYD